ncbi:CYTH domain-containing protein [Chromohalobacter moromii]|uniref:CYTH domain-containing protein n=1 Tax=Chromohalobacter moromii TaxID=2860329 RepID=A0A9X2X4Q4_9GAMM|nr:CYTH domain-containing protein [Chromohalobacter moromii]MCK2046916.1 CYTH domain-containing protein [Chromohalobacter moromii]MCT8506493.1 CYTH domain-containing protein [Chromohalobacter moromii]
MAQEIELKLALGASGPHALRQHPRLAGHDMQRAWLANTYYDTPGRVLERARIALRIRRTPDGYLQTLKTAGSGQGGLHARGEWEWPIDGDELDIDGIRQHAPDTIDAADLAQLLPRFTTDFTRERWDIVEADATIEVALDIGTIHAGDRQVPIRELELELKAGSAEALWQLAASLADGVALRPANASKAQRGAALHDGWTLPDNVADAPSHWNAALEALDAWQDTGHANYRHRAGHHLQALGGNAAQRLASALRDADDARPDTWLTPEMSRDWLAAWHHATA